MNRQHPSPTEPVTPERQTSLGGQIRSHVFGAPLRKLNEWQGRIWAIPAVEENDDEVDGEQYGKRRSFAVIRGVLTVWMRD